MLLRRLFALFLCAAAGCSPEPGGDEALEAFEVIQIDTPPIDRSYAASQAPGLRVVYAFPEVHTPMALHCRGLAGYLDGLLYDTLITDAGVIQDVERITADALVNPPPDENGHGIDARKWVVFQPATSSADTLCLGELWGFEREGVHVGHADSLVVYVNSIVYGPEMAGRHRAGWQ